MNAMHEIRTVSWPHLTFSKLRLEAVRFQFIVIKAEFCLVDKLTRIMFVHAFLVNFCNLTKEIEIESWGQKGLVFSYAGYVVKRKVELDRVFPTKTVLVSIHVGFCLDNPHYVNSK